MTFKRRKYGNTKTEIDGIKFDSKKEAHRYIDLSIMVKAGLISDLKLQHKFNLVPSQKGGIRKELPVSYTADFVYTKDGKTIIEDCKGVKTIQYIIKRKLMKLQGNEITEL
jgi:hypothetical protein